MFSVGSEYTRVEKTLKVATVNDSKENLDVCVNARYKGGYINCGRCFKCLRTLATLDIHQKLHNYRNVFELNAYQKQKDKYFSKILNSQEPLEKEIIDFAKAEQHKFSVKVKILSILRKPAAVYKNYRQAYKNN